jgi:hypothetical protein
LKSVFAINTFANYWLETGYFPMREDPQPGCQSSNPPAGLIRIHHTALPDGFHPFGIHRLGRVCQLLICLTPTTAADLQTKDVVEHFADFAIRDTQTMLEISRQGFGTRTHHDACRSARLRSLLGMLRAHSFAAVSTIATVGHKTSGFHFHHRHIGHVLLMGMKVAQLTPALWTTLKWGGLCLLDLMHLRQFPMHKLALSALASRPSRLLHPMPSHKRCRLAFPGALQFFHTLAQLLVQLIFFKV